MLTPGTRAEHRRDGAGGASSLAPPAAPSSSRWPRKVEAKNSGGKIEVKRRPGHRAGGDFERRNRCEFLRRPAKADCRLQVSGAAVTVGLRARRFNLDAHSSAERLSLKYD